MTLADYNRLQKSVYLHIFASTHDFPSLAEFVTFIKLQIGLLPLDSSSIPLKLPKYLFQSHSGPIPLDSSGFWSVLQESVRHC